MRIFRMGRQKCRKIIPLQCNVLKLGENLVNCNPKKKKNPEDREEISHKM